MSHRLPDGQTSFRFIVVPKGYIGSRSFRYKRELASPGSAIELNPALDPADELWCCGEDSVVSPRRTRSL